MKRVIITGANGFLGRHSISSLKEYDYEIHAVSSQKEVTPVQGVIWHQTDLFDTSAVRELFSSVCPTHLLHFAWYTEHGKFWESPKNLDWLETSLGILKAFGNNGGERIVTAGTCAEYDWQYGFCSEFITPCRPATFYGVCKNALQEAVNGFCNREGISQSWGRIFFNYGPGEADNRFVSSIMNNLLDGKNAKCTTGHQIRDFLYIEDVASAFVALLDSDVIGPVNICSGIPLTLKDFGAKIEGFIDRAAEIEFGAIPINKEEPPLIVGDNQRLWKDVGWQPSFSLETGIRKTIKWWEGIKQG